MESLLNNQLEVSASPNAQQRESPQRPRYAALLPIAMWPLGLVPLYADYLGWLHARPFGPPQWGPSVVGVIAYCLVCLAFTAASAALGDFRRLFKGK